MRRRLVFTLVSMSVGILVVFGIVRAYSTAGLVHDQQVSAVDQAADIAAVAIATRASADDVTTSFLSSLTHPSQSITYTDSAGAEVSTGAAFDQDGDIRVTRPVDGGGSVTLTQDAEVGSDQIADALLPLALSGLALALIAGVIGSLLARRFAYPFRRLADDAVRIGNGQFDVEVHRSSISEAADLGEALSSAAQQLDRLVKRERELAVIASHELRTPITSLRLSLEDLTLWPQTPPDVAAELQRGLGEVDRLSAVVTNLLERGDGAHLGTAVNVDLNQLAGDAVTRWRERVGAAGRQIVLTSTQPLQTTIVPAPVTEVVDALIENALQHGTGTISITVESAAAGSHLNVRVADEGQRRMESGVLHASPTGEGAGIADAATHAESLGGYVSVDDAPNTSFTLMLPRRRRSDRRDGSAADRRPDGGADRRGGGRSGSAADRR